MDRRLPKERQGFPNRAADASPASPSKFNILRPFGTNNDNELSAEQKTLKAAFQSSIKLCTPQRERRAKFSLLSRVVNHLKNRHLEGSFEALSVQEILEEMFILNELKSNVVWLENEALPNTPKIDVAPSGKFCFKPKYNIFNRVDLYQLLKHYDNRGLGGIEYNDIAECVKDADKVIKSLGDNVFDYTNPKTKKRVIYFNDKIYDLKVDNDLKEMWRSVCVESVDEKQVQEYLTQRGLTKISVDDTNGPTTLLFRGNMRKLSNKRPRRPVNFKSNAHIKDILQQYPLNKNRDGIV
ncbi:hypothetical protein ACTXT7_006321 [Hymenolepis weldensis]